MRRFSPKFLSAVSAAVLFLVTSHLAVAQSGSRSNPRSGSGARSSAPSAGSGPRVGAKLPVALEGYCPVSLQAKKKWVRGNPAIQVDFDGHRYLFANEQGKQMFVKDPLKFAPVLGGDCVVSLAKMGKRVPGSIRQAALHGDRLYLFANEQGKKMFLQSPQEFENADLAYGGKCVVCGRNMQRAVAGKPEFTVVYNGLRYLFPAAQQRDEFLSHPQKYEVVATSTLGSSKGSGRRQPAGSGSGRR